MMNGGGMSGGFFGFGFFAVLIILAIVLIIIWMMKPKSPQQTNIVSNNHKLEILKERLAKGEISEEEYDRLKRKLGE